MTCPQCGSYPDWVVVERLVNEVPTPACMCEREAAFKRLNGSGRMTKEHYRLLGVSGAKWKRWANA